MMSLLIPLLLIAIIAASAGAAYAQALPATPEAPAAEPGSGYQDAQLYWREIGQASDWESLKSQLRRWHGLANPGWDEAQVDDIARAVNHAVFRFAEPARG